MQFIGWGLNDPFHVKLTVEEMRLEFGPVSECAEFQLEPPDGYIARPPETLSGFLSISGVLKLWIICCEIIMEGGVIHFTERPQENNPVGNSFWSLREQNLVMARQLGIFLSVPMKSGKLVSFPFCFDSQTAQRQISYHVFQIYQMFQTLAFPHWFILNLYLTYMLNLYLTCCNVTLQHECTFCSKSRPQI